MGVVALFEVEPDALDAVEFRAVGRQVDRRDVVRPFEALGGVPSGLVEDEDGMGVRSDCLAQLG